MEKGAESEQFETAISLIAQGCIFLGWSVCIENNPNVDGAIIGSTQFIERYKKPDLEYDIMTPPSENVGGFFNGG